MKEEDVTEKEDCDDLGPNPGCVLQECHVMGLQGGGGGGAYLQNGVVGPGRWPLPHTKITWEILTGDFTNHQSVLI